MVYSLIFSRNSEADALEFLENIKEMRISKEGSNYLPCYIVFSDVKGLMPAGYCQNNGE